MNICTVKFCIFLLVLPGLGRAEIILPQADKSGLRMNVFVDDNYWEVLDRNLKLPSQNPFYAQSSDYDPRDVLINKERMITNKALEIINSSDAQDFLIKKIIPQFSILLRAEQGENASLMETFKLSLKQAIAIFEKNLPELEKSLSLPGGGKRVITILVAPWERTPLTDSKLISKYLQQQRFASGQMGFSEMFTTPIRDFGAKHFLRDEESGEALEIGQMGNLFHRLNDQAQATCALILGDETFYQVPPFAFPLSFLVKFSIAPGNSQVDVDFLAGLHPLHMKMEPASKNNQAEIDQLGVPQVGPLSAEDSTMVYPMVLTHFTHKGRSNPKELKLNLQFGVSPTYHPFKRSLELMNQRGAWKLTPYLQGHALKAGLKIPVQIHITSFDLGMELNSSAVSVSNLQSALNLELPAGIKVGLVDGKVVDQAGRDIQNNMNAMIVQNIALAKQKTRAESAKVFPVAPLFIQGQ